MRPIDILRNAISRTSSNYRMLFDKSLPATKPVLADLAVFCRVHETTFHTDPRTHALLEGRREVFLHIQKYLNLSDEQLAELRLAAIAARTEQP